MSNESGGFHGSDSADVGLNEQSELLSAHWGLGWHDRGHGHGDFGVVTVGLERVVFEKLDKDLAEHVIKLHNDSLTT